MFHRNQRHVHPGHFAQFIGPLSGTIDHGFTKNFSIFGLHSGDLLIFKPDTRYRSFFNNGDTAHPCAFGQCLRDVRRIGLSVRWQKCRSDYVFNFHQRPQFLCFLGTEQLHFQTKTVRSGGLSFEFRPAFFGAGQTQTTVHFPAGGLSGFALDCPVQFHAIFQNTGDVGRTTQLPDQASRMKSTAASQLSALQQKHIFRTFFRQMISDTATDDASTDDNDLCLFW